MFELSNKIDSASKIINSVIGEKNLSEKVIVDVVNSLNATSQPKVSVLNIMHKIEGTGKVKIYFENDEVMSKIVENTDGLLYKECDDKQLYEIYIDPYTMDIYRLNVKL